MSRTWRYWQAPICSASAQAASSRALAVALGQRQQAQAGAVAVLGMPVLASSRVTASAVAGADALAPVDQPLRRPFHVRAVRGRHVRSDRW